MHRGRKARGGGGEKEECLRCQGERMREMKEAVEKGVLQKDIYDTDSRKNGSSGYFSFFFPRCKPATHSSLLPLLPDPLIAEQVGRKREGKGWEGRSGREASVASVRLGLGHMGNFCILAAPYHDYLLRLATNSCGNPAGLSLLILGSSGGPLGTDGGQGSHLQRQQTHTV
ncbi:hypothetical protein Pcinc_043440 [Petrolisthes cinctipes]|uniref:Uncharacterized protein n=1 Tax=Petrolisthes cinctipes TaxID=88211 RepID=A0AAE1BJ47_PETCI|nr:hypothetical protein Pcinc_043440 [Petrolisthes cinctipes]